MDEIAVQNDDHIVEERRLERLKCIVEAGPFGPRSVLRCDKLSKRSKPMAIARLSATTGDGATSINLSYNDTIERQSVSSRLNVGPISRVLLLYSALLRWTKRSRPARKDHSLIRTASDFLAAPAKRSKSLGSQRTNC
jgi:hypothetical protein